MDQKPGKTTQGIPTKKTVQKLDTLINRNRENLHPRNSKPGHKNAVEKGAASDLSDEEASRKGWEIMENCKRVQIL